MNLLARFLGRLAQFGKADKDLARRAIVSAVEGVEAEGLGDFEELEN